MELTTAGWVATAAFSQRVTKDFDPTCLHQNCQGCILAFIFVSFRAQNVSAPHGYPTGLSDAYK